MRKARTKEKIVNVLPPAGQPRGPIRFTSQRCFLLSERVWEWALATLPFDLLIFYLPGTTGLHESGALDGPLTALLCIAAAGTFREQLLNLVTGLRRSRSKLTDERTWIFVAVLGCLGMIEIILHVVSHPSKVPLFVAFIFAAIAGFNAVRSAKALKQHGKKFLGDRMAQVEQANVLNLAAVAIPICAARLVSVIMAVNSSAPGTALAGMAASAVLILALRPVHSNFMAPCPRCRRMTSRVLITDGCCPFCEPQKFLINSEIDAENLVNELR